jgi:hypothetical protein
LKATSPKNSGISRVKHGAALAFSDAWKNVKEKIFWRVIQPDLKSNIVADDITLEGILEMKFANIKGGTLTQKDEFVKEIMQNVIDDLIDDGIINQTKKKDVYRPIKKN